MNMEKVKMIAIECNIIEVDCSAPQWRSTVGVEYMSNMSFDHSMAG